MDRVIISGKVEAKTPKAVLLVGDPCWYALSQCQIVSGKLTKGEYIKLSVPQWMYERNQSEQHSDFRPTSTTGNAAAGIPSGMLRRLIQLCHPDKHGGKDSARIATEWLLKCRAGHL